MSVKPGFRHAPVTFDRDGRDVQHFRRLFDRKAAEIAQFDDARLLLVNHCQSIERLVERKQLRGRPDEEE